MTIERTKLATNRTDLGFSMIDVLIAIVVLATGLLALAVLQGAMTRNSSDARARSQIAAYTDGLIDQLRAGGYDSIAAAAITPTSTTCPDTSSWAKEAYCAQTAAGVSNLSTTITSTPYYGDGAGGWSTTAPANLGGVAQYKQVNVTTTWTDALGQAGREVSFDTTMSATDLATTNTSLINQGFTGGPVTGPIVRESNPASTAGVIPIAISSNANAAATNPAPVVTNTGTTFSTFTYQSTASTYGGNVINDRVDTKVIQCTCQYTASGGVVSNNNNTSSLTIFAQPYRPTYWDGFHYVTPTAVSSMTTSTTGVPSSGTTQDPACDVCCRDRNDKSTDTVLYDNFSSDYDSSGNLKHYQNSNGTFTAVTTGSFVNACRLIRVNGSYAAATDLHNYFYGLLTTDTCASEVTAGVSTTCNTTSPATINNPATSPLPTSTAETSYAGDPNDTSASAFVKDYLYNSLTSLKAGTGPYASSSDPQDNPTVTNTPANSWVSGYSLSPSAVSITTGSNDYRYVYSRGLFVDHLEAAAVTALKNAFSSCSSQTVKATVENCVLPVLPFTSVNMTELSTWTSSPGSVINFPNLSTASAAFNPAAPSRGSVKAVSTTNNASAYAVGTIGVGNTSLTGILSTANPQISPYDASTTLTDQQQFTISSSTGTGTGSIYFNVGLSGLPQIATNTQTSSDPNITGWLGLTSLNSSGSGNPQIYQTSTKSGNSTTYSILFVGSVIATPTNPNCKSNCTYTYSTTPNAVTPMTPAVSPSTTMAGVQLTIEKYNTQTTGSGGTGTSCAPVVATTCQVYDVSSISVNGTALAAGVSPTGWNSTAAAGANSTNRYGLNANQTVALPVAALSSTSSTSPDLVTIGFTQNNTNSYTVAGTCGQSTTTTCNGGGNNCTTTTTYSYTAGSCSN